MSSIHPCLIIKDVPRQAFFNLIPDLQFTRPTYKKKPRKPA